MTRAVEEDEARERHREGRAGWDDGPGQDSLRGWRARADRDGQQAACSCPGHTGGPRLCAPGVFEQLASETALDEAGGRR